jgi:methionyl-tRNA formyltransferase
VSLGADLIKRIVVIGNGKMAADAVRQLAVTEGVGAPVWMHHHEDAWSLPLVQKLLRQHPAVTVSPFRHVSDADVVGKLTAVAPDLILSVNNFDVFPASLLTLPRDGMVNFHNGPLPAYRGLNIPSWAIINREPKHGVSWHRVEAKIDTGSILARAEFDLAADETAISLKFKCIQQGLALLPGLLEAYVQGRLEEIRQTGSGRYYGRGDIPNDGVLDLSWPGDVVDAFLRGLMFRPYPNSFCRPTVRLWPQSAVSAEYGEYVATPSGAQPGTVLGGTAEHIDVACRDGLVRLYELRDQDGADVDGLTIVDRAGTVHG